MVQMLLGKGWRSLGPVKNKETHTRWDGPCLEREV